MTRFFALLFAVIFLGFGILGFIPELAPQDELFGVFRVNVWQCVLHLLTGVIAAWMIFLKKRPLRLIFQVIGMLYGFWAILGFIYEDTSIFGVIANNPPVTWLHVIMAVVALILGFGSTNEESR